MDHGGSRSLSRWWCRWRSSWASAPLLGERHPSTETSTTVPRQQFFNIAQGITRFDDKDIR
jgi:hypothetical protein